MRPLAIAVPAALATALGLAAPAAGDDTWRVPHHAAVTVEGHGYGHGHGMSQYGAEGAARTGLGYRRIVEFYYPGTHWGRSRGRVTVLVSADTTDDLIVRARRGLTVRDTGRGGPVELPRNGAAWWKAAVGRDGVDRVLYRTDRHHRWHRWRALRGRGEFFAQGRPIGLVTPSGTRAYRGRLRTGVTGSGDRVTVNAVGIDSYLRGVVPLEMPASWHLAAVRAQAVAARTYASYERRHPLSRAYQLCDTTSCQVYGGAAAEHRASDDAVAATAGRVLLSGGVPALTQFGSSSGGWTAAGSAPYLPAKRDPYDGWSGNPVHSWSVTVRDRALERAWPRVGDLRRIVVRRRDGHGEWGGRVSSVQLKGTAGRVTVSGDAFRSALGLRSTWVTFRVR